MYADCVTPSMERAIVETQRRRDIQKAYNDAHGIVPKTIVKDVRDVIDMGGSKSKSAYSRSLTREERIVQIRQLKKEMQHAAQLLEFEHAAYLRDRIRELEQMK